MQARAIENQTGEADDSQQSCESTNIRGEHRMDIYSGEAENQWHIQDKMQQAERWRLARSARAGQQSYAHALVGTVLASAKFATNVAADAATSVVRTIQSWYSRPSPEC